MNHQNHSNLPPGNNSSTWNEHRWQFILLYPRDPLKQTRKHRSLNIEWMMSRLRSHHIMKFNQNNVYKMVGFGGCWFKVATKGLQLDTLIFPNFNLRWNPRPVGTPWHGRAFCRMETAQSPLNLIVSKKWTSMWVNHDSMNTCIENIITCILNVRLISLKKDGLSVRTPES